MSKIHKISWSDFMDGQLLTLASAASANGRKRLTLTHEVSSRVNIYYTLIWAYNDEQANSKDFTHLEDAIEAYNDISI